MPEDIPIPGIIPLASCRNCTLLTSALKVDTSWLGDLHKVRPFINDVRTEGSPMELIVPIGCVLVLVTRGGGSNIPKISQKLSMKLSIELSMAPFGTEDEAATQRAGYLFLAFGGRNYR